MACCAVRCRNSECGALHSRQPAPNFAGANGRFPADISSYRMPVGRKRIVSMGPQGILARIHNALELARRIRMPLMLHVTSKQLTASLMFRSVLEAEAPM